MAIHIANVQPNIKGFSQVMELFAAAEEILGRTINPTLYTAQDFTSKLAARNQFLQRVMEQALIPLWDEGLGRST